MKPVHRFDPKFALFRARDAADLEESGVMTPTPLSETQLAGAVTATEAGVLHGSRASLLFSMPGMSLSHVWFKSGFPLPRHSHDSNCLYYIVAGSLRIGTEDLVAGDGFFVGSDVPYAYTPGPQGVEVLKFRTTNSFDIKVLADNPAFWARAAEIAKAKAEVWATETMPSAPQQTG